MTRKLPRLHVITDDDVLAAPPFLALAKEVLTCGDGMLALHLRGHGTSARVMHGLADSLARGAAQAGALLVLNDRVDIALAVGAPAIQVGCRSLPVAAVRRLVGNRLIGYSAHDADEAISARRAGTDYLLLGTIYESASHAGRVAAGVRLVRETAKWLDAPLLAIGGITPERVAEVTAAGAYGVAVLSSVWRSEDPAAKVSEYLAALAGSRADLEGENAGY